MKTYAAMARVRNPAGQVVHSWPFCPPMSDRLVCEKLIEDHPGFPPSNVPHGNTITLEMEITSCP